MLAHVGTSTSPEFVVLIAVALLSRVLGRNSGPLESIVLHALLLKCNCRSVSSPGGSYCTSPLP